MIEGKVLEPWSSGPSARDKHGAVSVRGLYEAETLGLVFVPDDLVHRMGDSPQTLLRKFPEKACSPAAVFREVFHPAICSVDRLGFELPRATPSFDIADCPPHGLLNEQARIAGREADTMQVQAPLRPRGFEDHQDRKLPQVQPVEFPIHALADHPHRMLLTMQERLGLRLEVQGHSLAPMTFSIADDLTVPLSRAKAVPGQVGKGVRGTGAGMFTGHGCLLG